MQIIVKTNQITQISNLNYNIPSEAELEWSFKD